MVAMDDDKIQTYNELKQNILKNIGNINVEQIKDKFTSYIESKRAIEKIKTVNDLYNILEERDFINEGNLEALQKLLKHLCSSNIVDKVDVENSHILLYKKDYPTNEKCQKCKKDNKIEESESLNLTLPSAPPLDDVKNLKVIETVITEISKNIGKDWRHLAVLLQLKECDITDIKKNYGNNDVAAAFEALTKWRHQNKKKSEKELIKKLVKELQCKDLFYHCDLAENIQEYLIYL